MRKDGNQSKPQVLPDAFGIELRALLRPSECFSSPEEVLQNEFLDIDEKRAILAGWASDLYAVESVPGLRELPGSHALVAVSDILAALTALDGADQHTSFGRRRLSFRNGRKRREIKGDRLSSQDRAHAEKFSSGPLELKT
jgi:hypothetical protein